MATAETKAAPPRAYVPVECPSGPRARWPVAGLLGAAAIVHVVLIPEHFGEGARFGWAFVVMALVQATLGVTLVWRPGAVVDDLARRSTLLLVALYILARVVPVPGETDPEEATIIGAVTVGLEVAALVALARLPRRRVPRLGPVPVGLLAAGATAVAVLLTTGSLRYLPGVDLSREFEGSAPAVLWRDYGTSLSPDSPRLTVYLTNHLVVFGSLFTLLLTGILAIEVGVGAALSRRLVQAGANERRHWFWLPALVAAPACCGAPLLGVVGPAAFAFLLQYGWIPLAVAVVIGSFSLSLGALRQLPSRPAAPAKSSGINR